jgi:hypothetical protein
VDGPPAPRKSPGGAEEGSARPRCLAATERTHERLGRMPGGRGYGPIYRGVVVVLALALQGDRGTSDRWPAKQVSGKGSGRPY